jgi:sugar phosphate permease
VYLITYISYALIHFQREFWSMSKPYISEQHKELDKATLSRFDTAQLFFYAFFLYICGILGDSYNQRYVLSVAFLGLAIFIGLLALPGFCGWTSQPYYYFVQIFIGIFNSFLLPCMIAIMGNWFPKKNRGFIVGMWATCNNFGNIAGIQIAAWLLKLFKGQWQWLMVIAAVMSFIIFLVVFFFLIPNPLDVNIFVEELTEKEALIAVATDRDVYDNVIRNSLAQPAAVVQQVRLSQQFRRLSMQGSEVQEGGKISFWNAWMLPRVMLYASAFFCTKLAVFSLLLQLPTFLKTSQLHYDDDQVANLSTLIDLGAMLGSMSLGLISDLMYGKRSPVALVAVVFSIILTFVFNYEVYDMPAWVISVMMFFIGFFISGLNNMISASCSADLGK